MKTTHVFAVLVGLAAIAFTDSDVLGRARVYHPTLGRFLQRDPIGTPLAPLIAVDWESAAARNVSEARFLDRDPMATPFLSALAVDGELVVTEDVSGWSFSQRGPTGQYVDGMNLYQYVGGNPVSRLDPSGLATSAPSTQRCPDCEAKFEKPTITPKMGCPDGYTLISWEVWEPVRKRSGGVGAVVKKYYTCAKCEGPDCDGGPANARNGSVICSVKKGKGKHVYADAPADTIQQR
jgi:hypothetical protein